MQTVLCPVCLEVGESLLYGMTGRYGASDRGAGLWEGLAQRGDLEGGGGEEEEAARVLFLQSLSLSLSDTLFC